MSGPGPIQTPSLSSICIVKKIVPAPSKLECVCRGREGEAQEGGNKEGSAGCSRAMLISALNRLC